MTTGWQILHVTDFHIVDPDDPHGKEHLRRAHYKAFLGGLVTTLQSRGLNPSSIVATGDFVEKGATEHFSHAGVLLEHLADQTGVQKGAVALCPGNHDVVRKLDKDLKVDEARAGYVTLAAGFANGDGKGVGKHGILAGPTPDGLHFLMLDSTLGANGVNRPGGFEASELDAARAAVASVPKDSLLVIASHHVVGSEFVSDIRPPFDGAHDRWSEHHIWRAARVLWRSLRDLRPDGPTLWLSGDIHYPCHHVYQGHHFVVSGRLGERAKAAPTPEVARQVSHIRIPYAVGPESEVVVVRYNRAPDTHGAFLGTWEAIDSDPLIHEYRPARSRASVAVAVANATAADGTRHSVPAVEVLDDKLEALIAEVIEIEGLYRFGRFETSETDVSLAWISIGPLLNKGQVRRHVVSEMARRIRGLVGHDSSLAVVVGVDCWGAVLATQIAVRTGIQCVCTATRGRGKHHLPQELIDQRAAEIISQKKLVIVVSDVVGTGKSVTHVQSAVRQTAQGPLPAGQEWHSFSVVCDAKPNQQRDCPNLTSLVAACTILRMPALSQEFMPPPRVLPPLITF